MIIMIDNYDSFTYNLVQYCWELGAELKVVRNDEIDAQWIQNANPNGIIISPGPGHPDDAGNIINIIRSHYRQIPIFGVCLGHQAIASAFGGRVVRAPEVVHGKVSRIEHYGSKIFSSIEETFLATRYHSLIVEDESFPSRELLVKARTENGLIMALEHKHYPLYGVQFHPESILSQFGHDILQNFLLLCNTNL